MLFMRKTTALPSAAEALPGRATPIPTATSHFVNGRQLEPPHPQGLEQAVFGLGCFWGAERKFWELGDGIYTTAVGYAGGHTKNPTYEEVCSARPGTTEVGLGGLDRKKSYNTHCWRGVRGRPSAPSIVPRSTPSATRNAKLRTHPKPHIKRLWRQRV